MHDMDRRHNKRVPISLPFEIKTTHGAIKGKTANMSTGGLALLLNQASPNLDDKFIINLIIRNNHGADLACKKRWCGKMVNDSTVYNAIGIQFIKR